MLCSPAYDSFLQYIQLVYDFSCNLHCSPCPARQRPTSPFWCSVSRRASGVLALLLAQHTAYSTKHIVCQTSSAFHPKSNIRRDKLIGSLISNLIRHRARYISSPNAQDACTYNLMALSISYNQIMQKFSRSLHINLLYNMDCDGNITLSSSLSRRQTVKHNPPEH